jgi:hypothetical protein
MHLEPQRWPWMRLVRVCPILETLFWCWTYLLDSVFIFSTFTAFGLALTMTFFVGSSCYLSIERKLMSRFCRSWPSEISTVVSFCPATSVTFCTRSGRNLRIPCPSSENKYLQLIFPENIAHAFLAVLLLVTRHFEAFFINAPLLLYNLHR